MVKRSLCWTFSDSCWQENPRCTCVRGRIVPKPLFGDKLRVLPRRSHLLHDLITQVFLQRLQNGIVVMGFIDVFVYAHHQHHRSIENPRNLGDCMKGRLRFMTAITSAYAHAYQATCVTDTRLRSYIGTSACRSPKPADRIFPTFVPQHEKEAMTPRDGPAIQTGVLALWMVKP